MADKPMTHTAWGYHRVQMRRGASGYWVEIGKGRHGDEENGHEDIVHLDRTPLGGWTGAIRLRLIGTGSPLPPKQPQRPAQVQQTGDNDGDEVLPED
jgi:hypothetical protein